MYIDNNPIDILVQDIPELCNDVLFNIFERLNIRDLTTLGQVSKEYQKFSRKIIIRKYFQQDCSINVRDNSVNKFFISLHQSVLGSGNIPAKTWTDYSNSCRGFSSDIMDRLNFCTKFSNSEKLPPSQRAILRASALELDTLVTELLQIYPHLQIVRYRNQDIDIATTPFPFIGEVNGMEPKVRFGPKASPISYISGQIILRDLRAERSQPWNEHDHRQNSVYKQICRSEFRKFSIFGTCALTGVFGLVGTGIGGPFGGAAGLAGGGYLSKKMFDSGNQDSKEEKVKIVGMSPTNLSYLENYFHHIERTIKSLESTRPGDNDGAMTIPMDICGGSEIFDGFPRDNIIKSWWKLSFSKMAAPVYVDHGGRAMAIRINQSLMPQRTNWLGHVYPRTNDEIPSKSRERKQAVIFFCPVSHQPDSWKRITEGKSPIIIRGEKLDSSMCQAECIIALRSLVLYGEVNVPVFSELYGHTFVNWKLT
jgi:F-box domain